MRLGTPLPHYGLFSAGRSTAPQDFTEVFFLLKGNPSAFEAFSFSKFLSGQIDVKAITPNKEFYELLTGVGPINRIGVDRLPIPELIGRFTLRGTAMFSCKQKAHVQIPHLKTKILIANIVFVEISCYLRRVTGLESYLLPTLSGGFPSRRLKTF